MFNAVKEREITLSFEKEIVSDSTQGSVGIFSVNNVDYTKHEFLNKSGKEKDKKKYSRDEIVLNQDVDHFIYKFGNESVTLSKHEYIVSNDVNESCPILPHFMRPLCYTKNVFLDKKFKTTKSPFDIENIDKNNIGLSDLVVFEYIQDSMSMYDFITNDIDRDAELSNFVQILLSVLCAQQRCKFVHNDLHMNNILISKCPDNLILKYIMSIDGKRTEYYVNTHGYIPTIIDYGYSYSNKSIGTGLDFPTISHDTYGIQPYNFDQYTDFFRFIPLFYFAIKFKYLNYKNIQSSSHNAVNILHEIKTTIDAIINEIQIVQGDTETTGNHIYNLIEDISNDIQSLGFNVNENFLFNETFISFLIHTVKLPYSRYINKQVDYNIAVYSLYSIMADLEKIYEKVYNYQFYYILRMLCDNIGTDKLNNPSHISKQYLSIINEIDHSPEIQHIDWKFFIKNFIALEKYFGHELYLSSKKFIDVRKNCIKTYFKSSETMLSHLLNKINYSETFISANNDKIVYVIDNIKNINYYEKF